MLSHISLLSTSSRTSRPGDDVARIKDRMYPASGFIYQRGDADLASLNASFSGFGASLREP